MPQFISASASAPIELAVKTVPGNLPQTAPLQPAPQFINPNLSGNVNFDANQQAAQKLQQLNGSPQNAPGQQGSQAQTAPAPSANAVAASPTASANFLIAIIFIAVAFLLGGWYWFYKRISRRKKLEKELAAISGNGANGLGSNNGIDRIP